MAILADKIYKRNARNLLARAHDAINRDRRYIAEVFDGADDALAALDAVQDGLHSTGFQTLDWLTLVYEELATSQRATPRVVIVSERNSGDVAIILPLLIEKKRTLRIAKFPDLGVSLYGGPILGPAILRKPRSIRRAWRAIRNAMRDVDVIRLERMPDRIGNRANPLITRSGVAPSRFFANAIVVQETVDGHFGAHGMNVHADKLLVERSVRKQAPTQLYRVTEPEDIARVFAALVEQQGPPKSARGEKHLFDKPAIRAFYERLVIDGSDVGLAHLFALVSDGVIVATLLGIVHDRTFTTLLMSTDGERQRGVPASRPIVVEAMKYFVALGVNRFDLGLGEVADKGDLGVHETPLFDLYLAHNVAAVPGAWLHRTAGRLRRNRHVRDMKARFNALRGLNS